jgi:transcriptional regulator with XRE-family HTH domain
MSTKSPSPIDKHVGSRLRMRRMMLGMSQEKLGKAFGLTFQQVQKYEKGVNRMGASRLQEAAQILNISVSFFFEGARVSKLIFFCAVAGANASSSARAVRKKNST